MLLANKGVQDELKMTDDQKEKVTDMMKDLGEKRKESFTKLKDLPKEEIGAAITKMMKAFFIGRCQNPIVNWLRNARSFAVACCEVERAMLLLPKVL